jgi:sulfoxide reductase heme-binding subunit YedZ
MKRWIKAPVFVLCLSPIFLLGWRALHNGLGANPIEFITHFTGDWTLRFLVIVLAITPLRKILRWPDLIRFRRMAGLFAFFYGCLHFLTYIWLDKFFDLSETWKDVIKRPFITAGFLAFVSMAPLAITSTAGWIRRLGGARWQMLHRLVYLSAIAGVVHYYWLVKSDVRWPLAYASAVGVLLVYRILMSRGLLGKLNSVGINRPARTSPDLYGRSGRPPVPDPLAPGRGGQRR